MLGAIYYICCILYRTLYQDLLHESVRLDPLTSRLTFGTVGIKLGGPLDVFNTLLATPTYFFQTSCGLFAS